MLRFLMWAILLYIAFIVIVLLFQRSLIYYPNHSKPKLKQWYAQDMSEIYLKTDDGLTLLSW
ncbi:MAG: hypothetical protein AB7F64_08110 [Gammaproteobacteria bacterium]